MHSALPVPLPADCLLVVLLLLKYSGGLLLRAGAVWPVWDGQSGRYSAYY